MSRRVEETERFEQFLATLEAHGAATPQGWQPPGGQQELADLGGFNSIKALYPYLKKAKEHGLVTVTPQCTGSGSSLRRQADRYHLKVTPAGWVAMRDRVVAEIKAETKKRASVKLSLAAMERSRLVKLARRQQASGGQRSAPAAKARAVPIDEAAVRELVDEMGDDEDLAGW